jgi:CO dehydrogenase/acetyl-CoA synthase delta subunit
MTLQPRKLDAALMMANEVAYVRISEASAAVAAEAFMLDAEWGPDEPIPLWPTETGMAAS